MFVDEGSRKGDPARLCWRVGGKAKVRQWMCDGGSKGKQIGRSVELQMLLQQKHAVLHSPVLLLLSSPLNYRSSVTAVKAKAEVEVRRR